MSNKKKYFNKLAIMVLILPIVLTGCISITGSGGGNTASDPSTYSGIYRSGDAGLKWKHASKIYTVDGQPASFKTANVTAMTFDPSDAAAVYIGTQHDGIFFSYDYGSGWKQTLTGKGSVNDLVVDFKDKCTMYSAVHNGIWKTIDCARTWEKVYFETLPNKFVTSMGINSHDNNVVYAGTSGGSLLKSKDFGRSWDVMKRFRSSITDIMVQNHHDNNIVYAVTQGQGIFKSTDAAISWADLMELPVDQAEMEEEEYKPFNKVKNHGQTFASAQDLSVPDGLIYINKVGMFRLTDGQLWRQVQLLNPKRKDTIYSVLVNRQNTDDIYYGTKFALYHTIDGGINWAISELPSGNAARVLGFSPDNGMMYLGSYRIK